MGKFLNSNINILLKELFLYFIFYSIIGWVYEIFLEVVVYKWGYIPREFFRGPIAPVYGIGAIILILLCKNIVNKDYSLIKKIIFVFILCTIVSTIIELISTYILEYTVGEWPWYIGYTKYKLNFEGRIALSTSIRFGLLSLLAIFIIQNALDMFFSFLKNKNLFNLFFYIILILFILDIVFAIIYPTNIKLNIIR